MQLRLRIYHLADENEPHRLKLEHRLVQITDDILAKKLMDALVLATDLTEELITHAMMIDVANQMANGSDLLSP